MFNPSQNWIEQIKHIVQQMINQKNFVLEGTVTSVDPNPPYKVKVNLEPYEIETGWLQVATPYAGNGYGLVLPPPDEGTPVKVIFDMGDLSNGMVVACLFSETVAMPNVPNGTIGMFHKNGYSFTINNNGVTITGKNGTQTF